MTVLLEKIVFPILLLSCTTAFAAKQDQVTACLPGRLKNTQSSLKTGKAV